MPDLKLYDILRLRAFAALDYFKFHRLVFFQGPKAFSLDGAVVHKDIGSVFLGNETIALGIAEPLYFTGYSHAKPPEFTPSSKAGGRRAKKKRDGRYTVPLLEKPTGPTFRQACCYLQITKNLNFVK
jgi:hypothetical protein